MPVQLNVLVDIDGGQHRTGVKPSEAFALAKRVHSEFGAQLRIRGVQCYLGHIQHVKSWDERRELSLTAMREAEKAFLGNTIIAWSCNSSLAAPHSTPLTACVPRVCMLHIVLVYGESSDQSGYSNRRHLHWRRHRHRGH
jgi:D-serine deaminase-like pyridoxal phosphate-dependent protein